MNGGPVQPITEIYLRLVRSPSVKISLGNICLVSPYDWSPILSLRPGGPIGFCFYFRICLLFASSLHMNK